MIKLKRICKVINKISKIIFGIIVFYFAMFGFMSFEDLQLLINAMTNDGQYQISEIATGWKIVGEFMFAIMAVSFFITGICEILPDLVSGAKKRIVMNHKEISENE